jgi:hypothetical protein
VRLTYRRAELAAPDLTTSKRGKVSRRRTSENRRVTRISKPVLDESILAVSAMSTSQKEALTDEIHRNQPNLLMAVLAQNRLGASFERVEVLLTILFVCFQAMHRSGQHWPVITEALQERCVSRLAGRIRFIKGMTPDQRATAVADAPVGPTEAWLLAYVFDQLTQSGIAAIAQECDKYVTLAPLSLVDIIALAGIGAT